MPHPIYGPPSHALTHVRFDLELPRRANGYQATVGVIGRSSTKRASLWTYSETFPEASPGQDFMPTDALHHLALIAIQDRPDTQARLEHLLHGGRLYEEPPALF